MSVGIFELVNGVLTKRKIAGKTLMDAQLNANSRNGVQNRIITGEINDIKDDISTINTHLSDKQNKAWNLLGVSNGNTVSIVTSNVSELLIVCYLNISGSEIVMSNHIPKSILGQTRIIRGAGGIGATLDTYQVSISGNDFQLSGVWEGGTSYLSSSICQLYGR